MFQKHHLNFQRPYREISFLSPSKQVQAFAYFVMYNLQISKLYALDYFIEYQKNIVEEKTTINEDYSQIDFNTGISAKSFYALGDYLYKQSISGYTEFE